MPFVNNKYTINPTAMSDGDARTLGLYLIKNKCKLLKKNLAITVNDQSTEFYTTHNLIIDDEHNLDSKQPRYFVISNAKEALGQGAYSKVREVIGFIEIDTDTLNVKFTPQKKEKVVKITNTKQSRKKNRITTHEEALREYDVIKSFPHIGAQTPKEENEKKDTLSIQSVGFFKARKDYAIQNRFYGESFYDAIGRLHERFSDPENLPPLVLKIDLIIALLQAYHNQIAKAGYAHRDIKSDNVIVKSNDDNTFLVHFLDLGSAKRIGTPDDSFGSPGFLAPELDSEMIAARSTPPLVNEERDIFSLGVLATSAINNALCPEYYFDPDNNLSGKAILKSAISFVNDNKSFDPDILLAALDERSPPEEGYASSDFFESCRMEDISIALENSIKDLLKKMTASDPSKRPTSIQALAEFQKIKEQLPKLEAPTQNIEEAIHSRNYFNP